MATTSIVQLTADLAASTASGAVSQLMPSGTVLPFAGRNVPSGWLLCDGSEISKATYANLYAALLDVSGTSGVYDTQVNPTTGSAYAAPAAGNFRLPDYRGLFLRGTGTASGGDATTVGGHQDQKTAKNGISASFSGTKNTHGHSDTGHGHSLFGYGKGLSFNGGASTSTPRTLGNFHIGGWDYYGTDDQWGTTNNSASISTADITPAGSNSITGDNETRPVNKGINYIIKV